MYRNPATLPSGHGKESRSLPPAGAARNENRPVTDSALLTLSQFLGLAGTALLLGSALLGVLLATRVALQWERRHPRARGRSFRAHRALALAGGALTLLHPLPLLPAARTTGLTLVNLVVPLTAPRHTLAAGLGAAAFDGLLLVTVAALSLRRLPRAAWRAAHRWAYAVLGVGLLHGLLAGDFRRPAIRLTAPDKVAVEVALVALGAAIVWRTRAAARAAPAEPSGRAPAAHSERAPAERAKAA